MNSELIAALGTVYNKIVKIKHKQNKMLSLYEWDVPELKLFHNPNPTHNPI